MLKLKKRNKMAITKHEIQSYIDSLDLVAKSGSVLTVHDPDTPSITIEFEVLDAGKTFRAFAKSEILDNMINAIEEKDFESKKADIYELLLSYNATTKLGSWEVENKNIQFSVEIPVEDSSITKKQFERIFKQLDHQSKMFEKILNILREVYKR